MLVWALEPDDWAVAEGAFEAAVKCRLTKRVGFGAISKAKQMRISPNGTVAPTPSHTQTWADASSDCWRGDPTGAAPRLGTPRNPLLGM